MRVPWIIHWPDKLDSGVAVRAPVSVLDVTPTILGLLDYDISNAGFEGLNALSALPPDRPIRHFGWGSAAPASLVQNGLKTVYWPSLDRAYRYDLATDPDESRPTILGQSETKQFRQDLSAYRKRSQFTFPPKRYRQKHLYESWPTACLGNTGWCYYDPRETRNIP